MRKQFCHKRDDKIKAAYQIYKLQRDKSSLTRLTPFQLTALEGTISRTERNGYNSHQTHLESHYKHTGVNNNNIRIKTHIITWKPSRAAAIQIHSFNSGSQK